MADTARNKGPSQCQRNHDHKIRTRSIDEEHDAAGDDAATANDDVRVRTAVYDSPRMCATACDCVRLCTVTSHNLEDDSPLLCRNLHRFGGIESSKLSDERVNL